jgi:uncharacterized OB-fold protein
MNFESELKKGRFVVGECTKCNRMSWPPNESCSKCFGELVWRQVKEPGIIIECSAIDDKVLAMAEFEGVIRILGSTSEKNLEPGQKVKIANCGFDQTPKFTFAST